MEAIIRSRLKLNLPGIAVDWGASAQGITVPRVVLYRIGGGSEYVMTGPAGIGRALVQADCYGATVVAAKGIVARVKAALSGWKDGDSIQAVFVTGERDDPPELGSGIAVYRASIDFIIHLKET